MLLTTTPKKQFFFKLTVWGVIFCWLAVVGVCFADGEPVFGFDDSRAPWHIEADSIQALGDDSYIAEGEVVITRGEKRVRADAVRFDGKSQSIVATGSVVMTAGRDVLAGERMEMNLADGTGTISGYIPGR